MVDRRLLTALAAAGIASAIGIVVAKRHRGDDAPAHPPGEPVDTRTPWTCSCGHELLVSGQGRHRLHWEPGAELGDPLLDDRCPSCDEPLLAQHATA